MLQKNIEVQNNLILKHPVIVPIIKIVNKEYNSENLKFLNLAIMKN